LESLPTVAREEPLAGYMVHLMVDIDQGARRDTLSLLARGSRTIAGVAESLVVVVVVAVAAFAAILEAVAAYVSQNGSRRHRAETALAGTAMAWT